MGSDAETHSQKSDEEKAQIGDLHQVLSLRTQGKKELQAPEGSGTPTKSLSREHQGLQRPDATITEPALVCTMASAYVLWFFASCFCGTPISWNEVVSDSFVCS